MHPLAVLPALFALAVLGSPLSAATLKLRLDPAASTMTFDVRVSLGFHSFVGTVEEWTLDLTMPENGDVPETAVVVVAPNAMKTGKAKRDEKMVAWLEQDTFAEIRYEMKTIERTASGLQAEGELALHGQTRLLTIPLTLERKDRAVTVRGEVAIDYREYDLEVITVAGVISVKPVVTVRFVAAGILD